MYPMQPPSKKIKETNQSPKRFVMMRLANISYNVSYQMHHEMPLDVLEGGLLISESEEECASSYLCISCT